MQVDGGGFEPPKALLTDLQSAPFGQSGTHPFVPGGPASKSGAGDGTRTRNLLITNQLLCQLSHVGVFNLNATLAKCQIGNGTYRARTYDPLLVRQMLSQLS